MKIDKIIGWLFVFSSTFVGVISLRLPAHYISSPSFKTKNSKISQQLVKDNQELRKGVNLGSILWLFPGHKHWRWKRLLWE